MRKGLTAQPARYQVPEQPEGQKTGLRPVHGRPLANNGRGECAGAGREACGRSGDLLSCCSLFRGGMRVEDQVKAHPKRLDANALQLRPLVNHKLARLCQVTNAVVE
ncbi:hypothetical protein NDU88_007152 [Pleurodeles waltl]|uniref:Uncharacterized protein n=1 Tax=Pleurodeles waltl TaxID=8319 RepID=A0AAV7SRX3_PLEWA|nr:hypothetical protein NDU88_007152 [Pleurodeles waltl]